MEAWTVAEYGAYHEVLRYGKVERPAPAGLGRGFKQLRRIGTTRSRGIRQPPCGRQTARIMIRFVIQEGWVEAPWLGSAGRCGSVRPEQGRFG